MPDWFTFSPSEQVVTLPNLVVRLTGAWLAGCAVALIALRGMNPKVRRTLPLTLVLMSVLIAMATQIIGDNIARAFSLVGALSIVRFRTAVSDSRDVAFVLASVVIGMSIGADQWLVAGFGLVVVAVASQTAGWLDMGSARRQTVNEKSKLKIQTEVATNEVSEDQLNRYCQTVDLLSASTSRKGASTTFVYQVQLKPEVSRATVMAELNNTPGVESVVWSQELEEIMT